ncbi:MAG TPA: SGNH/GDSL hydrolase family protein [Gemmataceae bacterium]|jgi:lysophospholipase L1-like esterase|nr:SGNH/GDSL hydrolase family protein [Gemmataceae bacterium]
MFLSLAMLALTPAADPPGVVREDIEWLDVWIPGNQVKDLPRVLLIGDSITRGYYGGVEERLKGKAVVARLTTSKSLGDPAFLDEVRLVLGQAAFDVVHFNNGLHGWGYTEERYAAALPELLATLRKGAPGAKLIWATTTPVREPNKLDTVSTRTDRVKARNKLAADMMAKEKIPTNDLFALVTDKPDLYGKDGTHFNPRGTEVQAEQVAKGVGDLLPKK